MKLLDPADDLPTMPSPAERAYLMAVGQDVRSRISNVATRWMALDTGRHILPVTIDDGAPASSYVTSPRAAYVEYARQETRIVGLHGGAAVRAILSGVDRILAAARIDRVVHIDNWLLSTNLHGDWDGADLPTIRRFVTDRLPDHVLAIRSVDEWSAPGLPAAARADGWVMVPSRQVWVTDDLARDWRPRNAFGNDRRLIARAGLSIEAAHPRDAARIADLYHQLYIGKYSELNPVFTRKWVAETMASGLVEYQVARGGDGTPMAVAGLIARNEIATAPVVGYDRGPPRSAGLYRIASWMFMQEAMRRGLRLHGSAGAAHFKRLRGAHGVIEYWAMSVDHLSAPRRAAIRALAGLLERVAVPMMRRNGW